MNHSPALIATMKHWNEILPIDDFARALIDLGSEIIWIRTFSPAPEGHELYPDADSIVQAALIRGGHAQELDNIVHFTAKSRDIFDNAVAASKGF